MLIFCLIFFHSLTTVFCIIDRILNIVIFVVVVVIVVVIVIVIVIITTNISGGTSIFGGFCRSYRTLIFGKSSSILCFARSGRAGTFRKRNGT